MKFETPFSVKSFNKTSEVYFQVDYLEDLREFLSSAFEIRPLDAAIYDDERAQARRAKFFNTLNNYLTWCALRKYINYASKPFRKAHEDFIKGLSGGKIADRRWKSCVMTTNLAFGLALARPFFKKTSITKESIDQVTEMVKTIKLAFNARILELDWLKGDKYLNTRKAIQEKINLTKPLIGFPQLTENELNETYHGFQVVSGDFLGNVINFVKFRIKWNLGLLHQNVNLNTWPLQLSPIEANAFYNYQRNQIFIPMGILLPPFYNLSQPMALNFGLLGSIIGHEVSISDWSVNLGSRIIHARRQFFALHGIT